MSGINTGPNPSWTAGQVVDAKLRELGDRIELVRDLMRETFRGTDRAINDHEERLTLQGERLRRLEELPWIDPEPPPQPSWGRHRGWAILGGWACGDLEATDAAIALCKAAALELMITHEWRLGDAATVALWHKAIESAKASGVPLILHSLAERDFAGPDLDAQAAKLAAFAPSHVRYFMDGLEAPNVIDRANEITKAMHEQLIGMGRTAPLLGSNPNDPLIESSGGVDWRLSFTPSAGNQTVFYTIWDNLFGTRHPEDHPGYFHALANQWMNTETRPAIGWVPAFMAGGIDSEYTLDVVYRLADKLDLPVVLSLQNGCHKHALWPALIDRAAKHVGR